MAGARNAPGWLRLRKDMAFAGRRLAKLLAFRRFSPERECAFLQYRAEALYRRARFGILAGLGGWAFLCLWDAWLFPKLWSCAAVVRMGLVGPLLTAVAWFAFRKPDVFKTHMQTWLFLAIAATAASLLWTIEAAGGTADAEATFREFWPTFSLLSLYAYAFVGLRPWPAAALGLAGILCVWLAGQNQGVERASFEEALSNLLAANLLGLFVCAWQDMQHRTQFRARRHRFALLNAARRERLNALDARDEARMEKCRAEAALTLARAEREKHAAAIADKERFLSAAYHDLQQPLSTIGLYARLARRKLTQGAELAVRSDLAIIENASQDIAQMFDSVRDTWEAGQAEPFLETLDVRALVEEIALDFKDCAERKGLQLRLRKPPSAEAWGRSDARLLKRALANLLGNALKYTEKGGALIGVVRLPTHLRIDIWDTGIGIAEEYRSRIFEEYFQIASPARAYRQGFGLGLAIVRRIEQNLPEHVLRVASKPGRGSRFSLYIPAEPRPQCGGSGEPESAEEESRPFEGRYVVVADDDRTNLDGLVQALSDAGCIAEGVDSLSEARHLFESRDRCPDLLLTDFLLGGNETGLDIVAALRENFEWATATPVLFVSGDPDIAAKLADFRSIHAIHRKPVRTEALFAQMRTLLEPQNQP